MSYGTAWRKVFGDEIYMWFLPFGGPDPEEGLDYDADYMVKGEEHMINN